MADAEKAADTSIDAAPPLSSLPPPSPPSPPSPPPSNPKTSVTAVLATATSRLDAFLAHLAKCLQTRSGAETVLLFACYASRLTGSLLQGVAGAAIRQSARRLIALAYKLPPSTTVAMAPPRPSLAATALQLGARFKALSALISETRTVGRLWGLLGLYFSAKALAVKTSKTPSSSLDSSVACAQITSLIIFQAAENVAYLASKKVLPFAPATQARLALLSARSWGLYVGMEAARLLMVRSRRQRQQQQQRKGSAAAADHDGDWQDKWNKDFYRNLAWAPLTVHWSSAQGFLPDLAVSALAFYPAAGGMVDLWTSTA